MPKTAPQRHVMLVGETRNVAIDCRGELDGSEELTGTPIITPSPASGLTLSNKAVSVAELEINGVPVPIGQALQFRAVAVTEGTYTVTLECTTDSTPAQTIKGDIIIRVKD